MLATTPAQRENPCPLEETPTAQKIMQLRCTHIFINALFYVVLCTDSPVLSNVVPDVPVGLILAVMHSGSLHAQAVGRMIVIQGCTEHR